MSRTATKATAASKANKATLVAITNASTAMMLTLSSQMEKLVMITMAKAELPAMKSTKVATTVSLGMIPTLRMTALVPLKTWDLFQLQ